MRQYDVIHFKPESFHFVFISSTFKMIFLAIITMLQVFASSDAETVPLLSQTVVDFSVSFQTMHQWYASMILIADCFHVPLQL